MPSKEISYRADPSEPRNHDGFSPEGSGLKTPRAGRTYSGKVMEAVGGIGLLALFAAVFYRVRELLAAFLLFSVVFAVVAIAVLILWPVCAWDEAKMRRPGMRAMCASTRTAAS